MSETTSDLKRTPLEAEHRKLGAHLGAFAGWLMPIEYSGTLAEHRAVREAVGLFDLTHLGEITVAGPGALATLQATFTNDISKVGPGGAQYNMLLNERGGIVDDLIVYRIGDDEYLVVPNAANERDVHRSLLENVRSGSMIELRNDLILIAPQGPRSFDLVGRLFPDAPGLDYMHCTKAEYRGQPAIVSRSGYTGERGFELWVPPDLAATLWEELLERGEPLGILPVGLAARDTLRLEMGYPLHGQDISQDRTPLEAAAAWAVSFDKGDFVGREPLLRQKEEGIPARLWGLRMQGRLIPRPHYPVFAGSEQVGETTSGTFSPTLRVGIAMAYLSPRDAFKAGDAVEVDVRGRRGEAEVVRPPFVDSNPKA
jgi:glycine cleavage system T protein (aminomethyltransferase)